MRMDPRYKKILTEIYGDAGVTGSDHDLAHKILCDLEIPHTIGKGRLCYNGEWTEYGHNTLLQNGPKIVIRRLFNVSAVPSVPTTIILGTGTGAYDRIHPGCQTVISDGGLVFGAPTDTTVDTADANYGDDKCTITKNFGTLTLVSGPYNVSEMALRNTDGIPLNFNRVLISVKQISTGGSLVAEMVVQSVPL